MRSLPPCQERKQDLALPGSAARSVGQFSDRGKDEEQAHLPGLSAWLIPNAFLKQAEAWKPTGRAKCWPVPARERQRDWADISMRPVAILNASSY